LNRIEKSNEGAISNQIKMEKEYSPGNVLTQNGKNDQKQPLLPKNKTNNKK